MYRCAPKAPRVTRTGTYAAQVEHHKEDASSFPSILFSIDRRSAEIGRDRSMNTEIDRRSSMSHSNTTQLENWTSDYTVQIV